MWSSSDAWAGVTVINAEKPEVLPPEPLSPTSDTTPASTATAKPIATGVRTLHAPDNRRVIRVGRSDSTGTKTDTRSSIRASATPSVSTHPGSSGSAAARAASKNSSEINRSAMRSVLGRSHPYIRAKPNFISSAHTQSFRSARSGSQAVPSPFAGLGVDRSSGSDGFAWQSSRVLQMLLHDWLLLDLERTDSIQLCQMIDKWPRLGRTRARQV